MFQCELYQNLQVLLEDKIKLQRKNTATKTEKTNTEKEIH